jgi:hypothetical protein
MSIKEEHKYTIMLKSTLFETIYTIFTIEIEPDLPEIRTHSETVS